VAGLPTQLGVYNSGHHITLAERDTFRI